MATSYDTGYAPPKVRDALPEVNPQTCVAPPFLHPFPNLGRLYPFGRSRHITQRFPLALIGRCCMLALASHMRPV